MVLESLSLFPEGSNFGMYEEVFIRKSVFSIFA